MQDGGMTFRRGQPWWKKITYLCSEPISGKDQAVIKMLILKREVSHHLTTFTTLQSKPKNNIFLLSAKCVSNINFRETEKTYERNQQFIIYLLNKNHLMDNAYIW